MSRAGASWRSSRSDRVDAMYRGDMQRSKRREKLVIRRDTIRELSSGDLEQARGGDSVGDACTHVIATQTQAPKL